MDLQHLKKLAKRLGSVLLMNGDQPDVIIMDYDRYLMMHGETSESSFNIGERAKEPETVETKFVSQKSEHLVENLNKEIQALNDEIRARETEASSEVV